MKHALPALALAACSLPAPAADISLAVGYMFNSDFEVARINQQPPEVSPGTGEPGDDISLDDAASFTLAVDFVFENQPDKRIGFYISHEQTEFDATAGLP